jgi:ABC-type phosphate/phosphonate transport system substrate-binding protein
MIYSLFGRKLTVTGYCGKHRRKGYAHDMILLRATRQDDGATRYYSYFTLRADGGSDEIDAATDAAPVVELTGKELAAAIEQAS